MAKLASILIKSYKVGGGFAHRHLINKNYISVIISICINSTKCIIEPSCFEIGCVHYY